MDFIEPYFLFRVFLFVLFGGLLVYDLIGIVFWFRDLPRLARRIIILKVLQFRSQKLGWEFAGIFFLFFVEGWLMVLLSRGF